MRALLLFFVVAIVTACSGAGNSPAPPPPCDAMCQDNTAVRGMREILKLAYNVTLQGKPVGHHDESAPCPLGGSVHIVGDASSNAVQGTTFVQLTYTFDACAVLQVDPDPVQNYKITLSGVITESGTIAVQPQTTSSLVLHSDAVTITGTVYDPASNYDAEKCPMQLGQDGARISGTICGRDVSVVL
jgi:hypothetical protein